MSNHGAFVVTSLFFTLIAALIGFAVDTTARTAAEDYYTARIEELKTEHSVQIEKLSEERQQLARQVADLHEARIKEVTLTAYSPTHGECDPDPTTTASMTKVRSGIVAVSRDLFDQGWVFGKKVYVKGHGIYEIADLMHKRYSSRVDIFVPDTNEAKRFGVKQVKVALLAS